MEDHSPILPVIPDAEALLTDLRLDYPFAAPTACRLLHDGFNTHYLITTPADNYVIGRDLNFLHSLV